MTTGNTSLLGLALPVQGELDGTWGDVVNTSITALVDSAVAGTTTLSADADVTLTTTVLAANQARQAIILWTASNGATTRNVTAPAQSKPYIVINAGTGSIVLRGAGPTTGITIVSGEKCLAAWNGTDFVKVASSLGTGDVVGPASATADALVAFNGTTGKLVKQAATVTVAQGGTGATSLAANNVLLGNGTSALQAVAPGTSGNFLVSNGTTWTSAAVPQVYPSAGMAVSTGTSWGTSKTTPTGDVVGTTDTQTLTNKTLNDPKISLGGTNGTSGQVPISQGAGLAPVWGSATSGILSSSTKVSLFSASGTFVAPVTGSYRVSVVGGGGSGGVAMGSATVKATGGGAGGLAQSVLTLTAGVSYTATVGAGGTAITISSGTSNGNAGGNSSFSGSGITTLTGNGGGAGQAAASGTASGASGGTGTNGALNVTGGGSGSASGTARAATGGGAVGWLGIGYSSGDASTSSTAVASSGGAGVGGASGNASATSTTATASGGGGSGGASSAATNGTTAGGVARTDIDQILITSPIVLNGVGSAGTGNPAAPTAGVTSGSFLTSNLGAGTGGTTNGGGSASTRLAGSGGACTSNGGTAGAASFGGGGGGISSLNTTSTTSGAGGSGFILIEW